MRVRLFTHTDLDGSGCVLAAQEAFGKENVDWSAHGYEDIDAALTAGVINDPSVFGRYGMVLISDISPDQPVAWQLDGLARDGRVWQFDHHKSRNWQGRFSWVIYDEYRCGAKLLFDWLVQEGRIPVDEAAGLGPFFQAINAYDVWVTNDPARPRGEALNRLHKTLGQRAFVTLGVRGTGDLCSLIGDELERREAEKIRRASAIAQTSADEGGVRFAVTISDDYPAQIGKRLLDLYPTAEYSAVVSPQHGTCGLYSRSGGHDVSAVAKARHPNGGGHAEASGFQVGSLQLAAIVRAAALIARTPEEEFRRANR